MQQTCLYDFNLSCELSSLLLLLLASCFMAVIAQLAIHPVQVTLLDSTKKKCTFLEEVAADLQLRNVHVVWQRAEEAGHTASLREAGGNP